MGFVDEVARGDHGVRLALPASFEQTDGSETSAFLADRGRGVGVQLSRCRYSLDLTPAHDALLRQDIERHARDLFVQFRVLRSRRDREAPASRLRTDDPAWSPVVEVSPRTVAGAPALEVIHRMSYEPGSELVLGHLLLPIRSGLFELRVFGIERMMTGLRESAVMARLLAAPAAADDRNPVERVRDRVSQRDFDDPALDPLFPEHPLSRVRRALGWLREEAGILVTDPAPAMMPGDVALIDLGAALVPPPRYLLHEEGSDGAQFARACLATTDGLALLTVVPRRATGRARTADELRGMAEDLGRQAVPAGSTDIEVSSRGAPAPDQRPGAEIHVRFTRDDAIRAHTAIRAFVDERGEPWLLTLGTSRSVPEDELFAQLDEVTRSFRRLRTPPRVPDAKRA